ncbi:uncharacterized protein LOC119100305 [Pollicipes pollicipes]|uniref:uncharacterized protein LOC119100305 n=1 Tax=Pollicipes pollicipes TaxID=41117 RepID=UPI001884FD64|nr:uncharacterized protein LOC119100305 [Pollicipes pollicipes]
MHHDKHSWLSGRGVCFAANAPAGFRSHDDGLSTKFDGKMPVFPIKGSFSYVDLNGVKQTVDYVVDESGYRVSGTNLPASAVTDVKALAKTTATKSGYRKKRSALPISDTPEGAAAKAESTVSAAQFYGKIPVFPIVGSFSYADLNGVKQTVDYVVDEFGYHVSGTNLPAAAVTDYVLPYSGQTHSVQPDASRYSTNLAASKYAFAAYNDFAANAPAGVHPQVDGVSTQFDGEIPVFPIVGSFSYADLNGVKQTVDYVVDEFGCHVSGTNLPAAAATGVKRPTDAGATNSGYRK